MKNSSLRHKHVQLDQHKLNRALRVLGAKTETEALDRALSVVVSEDKIDTALRKARGYGPARLLAPRQRRARAVKRCRTL